MFLRRAVLLASIACVASPAAALAAPVPGCAGTSLSDAAGDHRAPDVGTGSTFTVGACSDPLPSAQFPATVLDVAPRSLRLRAQGRQLRVPVAGQARPITAKLIRGGVTIARGRLERLRGYGTIVLRASRQLRNIGYHLRLEGAGATRTFTVRLR